VSTLHPLGFDDRRCPCRREQLDHGLYCFSHGSPFIQFDQQAQNNAGDCQRTDANESDHGFSNLLFATLSRKITITPLIFIDWLLKLSPQNLNAFRSDDPDFDDATRNADDRDDGITDPNRLVNST
jgi:hypothetical protein